MINLIPPVARKAVTREYWTRVVTTWALLVSFALMLVLVMQLPTYVLVGALEDALAGQINTATEKQGAFSDLEDEIKEVNALISHLGQQEDADRKFSELIYELDVIAPETVTITQLSMQREDAVLETIDVIGVAANRTALSNFRDAIEAHEDFDSAELPISNLAKDRDILFSMTVSMANKK